jgi:pantothenate kinase
MIFVQVSTLASILNILLHSNGTAKGLTMVPTDIYIYDHSLLLEERKTNIDDDRGLSRACRW